MASTDETAVVTGAAVGIGQRISIRLAEDGYHVVGLDIQDGADTVDAVEAAGGTCDFHEADVTDPAAVRGALEAHDRIDVLVNNAAIYKPLAGNKRPFHELPEDEWDDVMAVNVKGVFVASKAAYPKLADPAHIVNISSNTAIQGVTGFLHYVASKGAVMSMTRAMANELGDEGVRVNAVMPGLTMTEASFQSGEDYIESVVDKQAIKERIDPDDIAAAVSFLAGPDSDMVSGQMLNVDGGLAHY